MKKGLLLTAFLATLILDMGAGPVFIVFGSIHLGKSAPFPSAAWLLVRGILNCVQFITVVAICWIVLSSKGIYSRKEERMLVQRVLLTNPIAYLYYIILLSGIVWNILGSCWILTAFRHYSTGFAACYLICVILSWISTAMSPLFVLFGGLSYSSLKTYKHITNDGPNVRLVDNPIKDSSITTILNQLNSGRFMMNIDQILAQDEHNRLKEKRIEAIPLAADEMPVLVTGIQADPYSHPNEDIILFDNDYPTNNQEGHSIVLIHRDMLDNEEPTQLSAWGNCEVVSFPEVQVIPQSGLGVRVVEPSSERLQERREESGVVSYDNDDDDDKEDDNNDNKDDDINKVTSCMDNQINPSEEGYRITVIDTASTDLSEQQRSSNEEEKEEGNKKGMVGKTGKEQRKKKRQEKRNQPSNPKANLVIVDVAMPTEQQIPPPSTSDQVNEIVVDNNEDNEYVDLSTQMIHNLNDGLFDVYVDNKNVHITHFH